MTCLSFVSLDSMHANVVELFLIYFFVLYGTSWCHHGLVCYSDGLKNLYCGTYLSTPYNGVGSHPSGSYMMHMRPNFMILSFGANGMSSNCGTMTSLL